MHPLFTNWPLALSFSQGAPCDELPGPAALGAAPCSPQVYLPPPHGQEEKTPSESQPLTSTWLVEGTREAHRPGGELAALDQGGNGAIRGPHAQDNKTKPGNSLRPQASLGVRELQLALCVAMASFQ